LVDLLTEAETKRVKKAEIIAGKGSSQLMKRVRKWLDQKEVKSTYKRIEIDTKNHGRMSVHFR
jgi:DNA-nicking Smr family endonuclease